MCAPPYSVPRTCGSQYIVPNQFFVWCISQSRALSAFFVELGALMMIASTMVPPFIMCPVCTIMRLIASNGIVGLDDTNPLVPGNDFVHDFRNSSRLVFFLRKLCSISVNVSCFIAYTIVALMGVLYHIWNLYGSAD